MIAKLAPHCFKHRASDTGHASVFSGKEHMQIVLQKPLTAVVVHSGPSSKILNRAHMSQIPDDLHNPDAHPQGTS